MMAMAIKPVKKKNKEQERTFSLRALVTAPLATLFFICQMKKLQIRKSSNFGVLQSPEVRIAKILFINKIIHRISILSF